MKAWAFLSLLLLGCAGDQGLVARYQGGEITEEELSSWQQFGLGGGEQRDGLSDIERLALTLGLAHEARSRGLDRLPQIELRLATLEAQAWAGRLRADLAARSEPPAEEIETYLEAHRDQLSWPDQVRLWNLFKRVPTGASDEEIAGIRAEIQGLRQRAVAGEDFRQLAAEHSDSETGYRGGRMGAVAVETLRPAIRAVVDQMDEDEVSPLIRTPMGFTVLWRSDRIEGRTLPDEEAKTRIRIYMVRRNLNAAWEELRRELLSSVPFEILPLPEAAACDEAPIARLDDGTLTMAELCALSRPRVARGGDRASGFPRERIAALISQHLFLQAAAERAQALGLELADGNQQRLYWSSERALGEANLDARLAEILEPVDDAAARAYFDNNRRRFVRRQQYELRVLRWSFDDGSLETEARRAHQTRRRLATGVIAFDEAATLSDHPSAQAGGYLGWRGRRQVAALGPAILAAAEQLELDEISEVIRQDDAYWIVQLLAAKPVRRLTWDEAEPLARQRLELKKRLTTRRQLRDDLLAELRVETLGPAG